MSGVDRYTFQVIDNRASAVQSIEVILSTELRERYQRRWFGASVRKLLGRLGRPRLLALYRQIVAIAIEIYEPRLRVCKSVFYGEIDDIRRGEFELEMLVAFRPNGHLGDPTEVEQFNLTLDVSRTGVRVL